MTRKSAIELSLKVWIWLFKNPDKYKEDSPYVEEINNFIGWCPLCALYNSYEPDLPCDSKCPLLKKACGFFEEEWLDCLGNYHETAYYKWEDTSDPPTRKRAAARIASVLRREWRKIYA